MHVSQMPNCCGIYLISNFGHTSVNGADRYNSYFIMVFMIEIFFNILTLKKN